MLTIMSFLFSVFVFLYKNIPLIFGPEKSFLSIQLFARENIFFDIMIPANIHISEYKCIVLSFLSSEYNIGIVYST